jgi:hypothetical protein
MSKFCITHMKLIKTPHIHEKLHFYLKCKYNIRVTFLQNNRHCQGVHHHVIINSKKIAHLQCLCSTQYIFLLNLPTQNDWYNVKWMLMQMLIILKGKNRIMFCLLQSFMGFTHETSEIKILLFDLAKQATLALSLGRAQDTVVGRASSIEPNSRILFYWFISMQSTPHE